ncbi:tRNA pseudouridine(55) synthase TruB [Chlamydiales bacterium]|nr:tRNA pseudouridine(55) synthase TruB [Chlamydiales bacterium]
MSEGLLLVDKPPNITSFKLVTALRKRLNVKKIGHAGTLDPFATGLMVMLVGKNYTTQSDNFINHDKVYEATLLLGSCTDSYDCDGTITNQSDYIPTLEEIQEALKQFQGKVKQTPPMFSAKKVNGKKLYTLARQGIEIERKEVQVTLETTFIDYTYPNIRIRIHCSKGTYIRSLAHDLGNILGCYAHLSDLRRIKCGTFDINDAITYDQIEDHDCPLPFKT